MDSGFVSNAPLIRTPGIRTKLHTLLHRPSETSAGRYLRIATFIVILLSTLCFVLQSIPSCHSFAGGFLVIDGFVAVAFTIEYVIKFVVVPDGRGDEENDGTGRAAPRTSLKKGSARPSLEKKIEFFCVFYFFKSSLFF